MSTEKKRIEVYFRQAPDYILEFRERIEALREKSGLTAPKFAESIGIAYNTYRTLLGKNPHRSGSQGASFQTIHEIATHLRTSELVWLLTGEEPGQEQKKAPGPTREVRELLDQTRQVLEADDDLYASALTQNIKALHAGVMSKQSFLPIDPSWPVDPLFTFRCRNRECGHKFQVRASEFCKGGFRAYCVRCGTDFVLEVERVRADLRFAGATDDQIDKLPGFSGAGRTGRKQN